MKTVYQAGYCITHLNTWVVVGYGNSKEEARADLNRKINESQLAFSIDYMGYRYLETEYESQE